jgi:hypothetical protein
MVHDRYLLPEGDDDNAAADQEDAHRAEDGRDGPAA